MRTDPLPIRRFSHICIAVSDIDRSLAFYRNHLGFDETFDVELEGAPLEAVTGEPGVKGRMVGGIIGGTTVELLQFSHRSGTYERPAVGYTNISLSVDDLDRVYQECLDRGLAPKPPVDIGGVKMFFLEDPDGVPIEIIEYPGSAETSSELWRGQEPG